jgi:prepilin-type processing-associated H-X9-DG protein
MKKSNRHGRSAGAFTLVELLVVIGIIAALIAMLLPALNRARVAAQAVTCASQMRQFGIGFAMYASAFNGATPFGRADLAPFAALPTDTSIGTNPNFAADWTGAHFAPYVGDRVLPGGWHNLGVPVRGKIWVCQASAFTSNGRTYSRIRSPGTVRAFPRLAQLVNPRRSASDIVLLYEAQYFGYPHGQLGGRTFYHPTASTVCLDLPHRNSSNFLYADGHVERLADLKLESEYARHFPMSIGLP